VYKQGSTNVSLIHISCQILLNKSNWTYTCSCYCSKWGYVTSHNQQTNKKKNEAPYVICIKGNIYFLTSWHRNFNLNFSTPVCKMWITQGPKKVALWNKWHFEEKNRECAACLKYSVFIVVGKKYIKCNIWRVAVLPSYIQDARFLKVKFTL
jgi:hypothetical protein